MPSEQPKKKEEPQLDWSPQQLEAIEKVKAWIGKKDRKQIFRLFGYAGTGKTTLAKFLAKQVKGRVLFAAFTGKASQVLRNKGCEGASTIHSLIYKAHRNPVTGIVTFSKNYDSLLVGAKLLIVDEVSMVGEEIAMDLLSFRVPILVLGDPAQLPPVKGSGYFINEEPDALLTEVHRQAAENPIIRLSMAIRQEQDEHYSKGESGGAEFIPRDSMTLLEVANKCLEFDQVLCGLNRTRIHLNKCIRKLHQRKDEFPEVGDRLVCLRNDHAKGIFNGSLWDVVKVSQSSDRISMDLKSIDDEGVFVDVVVLKEFFTRREQGLPWQKLRGTQQFTYGYVLTVHKSQGSQWDNVLLFDESFVFGEDRVKHFYTGVTRAAVNLTVIA